MLQRLGMLVRARLIRCYSSALAMRCAVQLIYVDGKQSSTANAAQHAECTQSTQTQGCTDTAARKHRHT